MKRLLSIIAVTSLLVGCNSDTQSTANDRSLELNNQALEYTAYLHSDPLKVDSAILLLDEATFIDSTFFSAYLNKIPFLMAKGDLTKLLETNAKIQELQPNDPNWIIQRGVILECFDEKDKAKVEFEKGIKKYESIIDTLSSISWEFEHLYAMNLVWVDRLKDAESIIARLKNENPDELFLQEFDLQTKEEWLELYKSQP